MLPASFDALVRYPQFIIWKAIHKEDGKIDKIPQTPTGGNGDAHNPANWMSYDQALVYAAALGDSFGIGFVFTENDPFFFIDLDHCYDPAASVWNDDATKVINAFRGACIEMSVSGTGAHIFGMHTGPLPNRKIQNDPLGVALYTELRFVALTGQELYPGQGRAGLDWTPQVNQLVTEYLTYTDTDGDPGTPIEWTSAPIVAGMGAPDADAALKVLKSMKSRRGMFDENHASPVDLWEANEVALARAYPSLSGTHAYDQSSADMALASHLAFVTGGNCQMMWELMWASGLTREKWHDRPAYVQETITKAVGRCSNWYTPAAQSDTITILPGVSPTSAPGIVSTPPVAAPGVSILPITQQIERFEGCIYVRDQHRVLMPDGDLVEPDRFKTWFPGAKYVIDPDGKTTKNAFEAFTDNQAHDFPKVHTASFEPQDPPGQITVDEYGVNSVNVFIPRWGKPMHGSATIMYEHIARLLPDTWDQQVFISWQAALIQYPGIKIPWAIVLQGLQGNGKSVFYRCLKYAIGKRYCHKLDANDLTNKFNPWIAYNLLIWCEEIWVAGRRDVANVLKPMISDEDVSYQAKRENQTTVENKANFFLCSNKKDAVLKTANDRRYAVLYTAQQDADDLTTFGMDAAYFNRLFDWRDNQNGLAIWAHELATYAIPSELNLHARAPVTSSTEEAIRESGGVAEHLLREAIESEEPGFTGGLVDVQDAADYLVRHGKKYSPRKVSEILRGLHYITHPALLSNSDNRVTINGRRKSIMCVRGSLVANIETPLAVVEKWKELKAKALLCHAHTVSR